MENIRIGIFGAGRGIDLAGCCLMLGAQVVAVCDNNPDRMEAGIARLIRDSKGLYKEVTKYDDFDKFLEHPMDAVILANNFYQHAPFAIKCFKKNLHVMCECISNGTMKEGVELVEAFEKSQSIYMLAENYPQKKHNREMKRLARSGKLGKIIYAEGEYNHPVSEWDTNFTKSAKYFPNHWRHFIPPTYYITHSLGPVMNITGATPTKVSAFAAFVPPADDVPSAKYCGDAAANITTLNDDGSTFRVVACSRYGASHSSWRVCGTKGQAENPRGMGEKIMLRYSPWETPEGFPTESLYEPAWNDPDEAKIMASGHGGGDYITTRSFLQCVKEGKQPSHPFDIYSATVMSSVAILGFRSILETKIYDIPDFRKEEDKALWRNDDLTPFWGDNGEAPTLPCCSHPDYKPSEKNMELYFKELEK